MKDAYLENGIFASQVKSDNTTNLSIEYKGLLFKSGADSVFAHFGYGAKWTTPSYVKMIKTENGFKANIPLHKGGTINLAFKDSADNWDNNSGSNYSFSVRVK